MKQKRKRLKLSGVIREVRDTVAELKGLAEELKAPEPQEPVKLGRLKSAAAPTAPAPKLSEEEKRVLRLVLGALRAEPGKRAGALRAASAELYKAADAAAPSAVPPPGGPRAIEMDK